MLAEIVLASESESRARLLRQANVIFRCEAPKIDEASLRAAYAAEGVSPRDQSDVLAEQKARKIGGHHENAVVIGSDQILALHGKILTKPDSREAARAQLACLAGAYHTLYTSVVVCDGSRPVWRHITESRLHMRPLTDVQIETYLERAWPGVQNTVGAYKIEEEGVRLFSQIDGDYFSILGLPLVPLLNYLDQRGLTGS